MLREFLIEDLEVDESTGAYAIQQIMQQINEVRNGELNNPNTVATVERVMRRYLSFTANIKKRVSRPVFDLCQTIINFAEDIPHDLISLQLKRLAIECAIIVKNHAVITRLQKKPCREEVIALRDIAHSLLIPRRPEREAQLNDSALHNVYLDIMVLFKNTALCIELLSELEARLFDEYLRLGVDLSTYLEEPDHYVFINLPWPSLERVKQHPRTYGVLNHILLEKERRHGINLHPDSPVVFAGFIEDNIAKDYIKQGLSFVEYNLIGNMLHGKNIHRIQWYLVFYAIEKGLINTRGLSSDVIFSRSSETWLHTFDKYQSAQPNDVPPCAEQYRFASPHYLHSSLLLLKNKLPSLCATLRKAFARGIQTVANRQPSPTSFAEVCAIYDIRRFNVLPAFDTIEIKDYQDSKQKKDCLKVIYWNHNRDNGSGAVFFKQRARGQKLTSTEDPQPSQRHYSKN